MNDIKDIVEEVKGRSDIVSTLSGYINLQPSGTNYKGLCPFHGEKTPSFYVNTSKQIYKCFGCGEGGDVINFVMKIENLEFMDAVKVLANKCGIEINTNMDEKTKLKIKKSKQYQDIHVEAARFYFANLINNKNKGYDYLRKRGLDDKTIKKFGLGFSYDSWNSMMNYLLDKGYERQDLVDSGLITHKVDGDKYFDRFRNRVMFPIFDYVGNVIGFGGRVLDDSLPKYLNSPDSIIFNKRYNLYGLNFARKNINNKTLVLVEGYMDLISLYQYGIKNVVATLGTALTEQQGQLIKRYADTVILAYDSDDAGIKAALRAIDILRKLDINVKVIDLQKSKDPDEYIRQYGLESFTKAMNESSHYIKYKIDNLEKSFNLNKDEERLRFAKESSNIIKKQLKSAVEIDYYAKYISNKIKISEESIKREIYGNKYNSTTYSNKKNNKNSYNKVNNYERKSIEKVKVVESGERLVEETLIKILLQNDEVRQKIILKIDEDDFILDNSKEILNYIIKNQELDKITIDKIKSLNISEGYINDLDKISLNGMDFENTKSIDEIIKNVKKNKLDYIANQLLKQQKDIEDNKHNIDAKEVDVKLMEIALKIVDIRRKKQSL